MLPILAEFHNLNTIEEIADLIITAHLMTGHATGFGKLVDEKILPEVFGAKKLDSEFRADSIYEDSCFDEIDHEITRQNGTKELLSLKAGRWTIQLTTAVQLNTAFNEIFEKHSDNFGSIYVGVFYGRSEDLTDKFDIIRGINRGKDHGVNDLKDKVFVKSGRDFWSWLNDGESNTQQWVMNGILKTLSSLNIRDDNTTLLSNFRDGVGEKYGSLSKDGEELDWPALLEQING